MVSGPGQRRRRDDRNCRATRERAGVMDGVDENGKSVGFGASFDAEDFVDSGKIDGIGSQGVKRICGNGDDRATIQPSGSVADDTRIGRIRAEL